MQMTFATLSIHALLVLLAFGSVGLGQQTQEVNTAQTVPDHRGSGRRLTENFNRLPTMLICHRGSGRRENDPPAHTRPGFIAAQPFHILQGAESLEIV
jgi:hypothetical protein